MINILKSFKYSNRICILRLHLVHVNPLLQLLLGLGGGVLVLLPDRLNTTV